METNTAGVVCLGQWTVEVSPVPQLEHQQLPQPQRMVAAPRQVLRDEAVDEPRPEVAALTRAR